MFQKSSQITLYLVFLVTICNFICSSSFLIQPSTKFTTDIRYSQGKSSVVTSATKERFLKNYSKEGQNTLMNTKKYLGIINDSTLKKLRRSLFYGFLSSLLLFHDIPQMTSNFDLNHNNKFVVNAISGGGKDYAEQDLKGSIFSKQKLNEKDFSGAQCQNCDFTGAQLRGARFYKSNLKGANFEGADLTGASLEGSALDETSFRNSILEGAYFSSSSLVKTADINGADFTEALLRDDMSKKLCDGNSVRQKASGENPTTGVATRDSLFCD